MDTWSFEDGEDRSLISINKIAQIIVGQVLKKAKAIVRQRRLTQFAYRKPSYDSDFSFEVESFAPSGSLRSSTNEDGIPRPPTIKRFLCYQGGTPVFRDTRGRRVFLNSPAFQNLPHVPGSLYEMKLIKFDITNLQPKVRACYPEEEYVPECLQCEQIAERVMTGIPAGQSDGTINHQVFSPYSRDASISTNRRGRIFGVGMFVLERHDHRITLRDFLVYQQLTRKQGTSETFRINNVVTNCLTNRKSITSVPLKKTTIHKPTLTISNQEGTCHPIGYFGQVHRQGIPLKHRHQNNKKNSSQPTKSKSTKGPSVKTIIADSLFNPGVKRKRPVRGFRTWHLTPDSKKRKLTKLQANRRADNLAPENDSAQTTNKPKPLAFHEPFQLMHGEGREEPNHIYMLMNDAGGKMSYDVRYNREPVSLRTVSLPRRGRIKLTALPYELDNPEYFDDRKTARPTPHHQTLRRPKFILQLPVLCLSVC